MSLTSICNQVLSCYDFIYEFLLKHSMASELVEFLPEILDLGDKDNLESLLFLALECSVLKGILPSRHSITKFEFVAEFLVLFLVICPAISRNGFCSRPALLLCGRPLLIRATSSEHYIHLSLRARVFYVPLCISSSN